MDVTFTAASLARAAQTLQSVVNPQTTLPILQNVLVEANKDNTVTLFASDLESYAKLSLSADVSKPGRITLPAKVLADSTKDLPSASVTLSANASKAKLAADQLKFQLATMPADDFPEWPAFKPETTITLPQATLREALGRVSVAIPSRDPRKGLMGAYFDLRGDTLRIVGTDGKRLVCARIPLTAEQVTGSAERGLIVPQKVVHELERVLDQAGTVSIQFSQKQIAFDNGLVVFVATAIDWDYPPYEQVIPKDFAKAVAMPRDLLLSNIRMAAVVQEKTEGRVILTFENGRCVVSAYATEVGTFENTLTVPWAGDTFRVCFNYNYLSELLKVMGTGDIVFNMNKPATPVVMNAANDATTYLIMPIKLTEYPPAEPVAPARAVPTPADTEDDADDEE